MGAIISIPFWLYHFGGGHHSTLGSHLVPALRSVVGSSRWCGCASDDGAQTQPGQPWLAHCPRLTTAARPPNLFTVPRV